MPWLPAFSVIENRQLCFTRIYPARFSLSLYELQISTFSILFASTVFNASLAGHAENLLMTDAQRILLCRQTSTE
jgi:hypothetical protein